jgi:hypothetical protein
MHPVGVQIWTETERARIAPSPFAYVMLPVLKRSTADSGTR